MIADIDKRRMTNYRYYTDNKWGMARNYTLTLNSSQLGYELWYNMTTSQSLRSFFETSDALKNNAKNMV